MAGKPKIIARGGEFLRIEPFRPEYAITSIAGRLDCLHVECGSELQVNIEPENTDVMNKYQCAVWLRSPAWSHRLNHEIVQSFDDGGFWVACIPNYKQYVHENKMLIKYVLSYKK